LKDAFIFLSQRPERFAQFVGTRSGRYFHKTKAPTPKSGRLPFWFRLLSKTYANALPITHVRGGNKAGFVFISKAIWCE